MKSGPAQGKFMKLATAKRFPGQPPNVVGEQVVNEGNVPMKARSGEGQSLGTDAANQLKSYVMTGLDQY